VAEVVPPAVWHDAWWAVKSSQTLAITALAAAACADPSLSWLPSGPLLGARRVGLFEVELAETVLNERPYRTQLDFLALGEKAVIAVEAKFTERGFEPCSCNRGAEGICASRIYDRPYWDVAKRQLGFRELAGTCQLCLAYQPVRNIAAAEAIAGTGRKATFALLYDDTNPYFGGAGEWPGWAAVLDGLTRQSSVCFGALSWQELLGRIEASDSTLTWMSERHGLLPKPQRDAGG
jgi:restriction endonuclease-like protein